jgi:hypothetical protein
MIGEEAVKLRLALPPGNCRCEGEALLCQVTGAEMALAVLGTALVRIHEAQGQLEIGPVTLAPKTTLAFDTALMAQVPAGNPADLVALATALKTSGAGPDKARTRTQRALASSVATKDSGSRKSPPSARLTSLVAWFVGLQVRLRSL